MKFPRVMLAVLMAGCVAVFPTGCEDQEDDSSASSWSSSIDLRGTWTAETHITTEDSTGGGVFPVTLYGDPQSGMASLGGYTASWSYSPISDTFTMYLQVDVRTIYTGHVSSPNLITGTTQNSQSHSGTFTMTR